MVLPTIVERDGKYINFPGSDAPGKRDMQNVTEIDGGILQYVRRQMHCERVTREVIRQAVAFEREMRSMNGW